MNVKITRDWTKSFFVMIVAVIIMGMCVSLLVMCDMGTDPFNMNLYLHSGSSCQSRRLLL